MTIQDFTVKFLVISKLMPLNIDFKKLMQVYSLFAPLMERVFSKWVKYSIILIQEQL